MENNPYAKYQKKKTKKDYKYPNQPMKNPVRPQQAIYKQPIIGQPQPYNMAQPQYYKGNPKQRGPIVAVPIGPPITVAQPIGPPMYVPVQPGTPPPVQVAPVHIIQQPNYQPVNRQPTIIIKRYYKEDDCCCNIF